MTDDLQTVRDMLAKALDAERALEYYELTEAKLEAATTTVIDHFRREREAKIGQFSTLPPGKVAATRDLSADYGLMPWTIPPDAVPEAPGADRGRDDQPFMTPWHKPVSVDQPFLDLKLSSGPSGGPGAWGVAPDRPAEDDQ